jgi:hypothetical protein
MNQTEQSPTPSTILATTLQTVTGFYLRDLKATPEDQLTASPKGDARSICQFTGEVAGFNYMVAGMLIDKPYPKKTPEEREAFYATIKDKASAVAAIEQSLSVLVDAINQVPEKDWATMIEAPWGQPISKFGLAMFASLHSSYHDGQLNYIQTLFGDKDMHWLD